MATSTPPSNPNPAVAGAACASVSANPRQIQRRARSHHKQARIDPMIFSAEPRRHLLQIKNKKSRVNRHIENTRGQREPCFLKAPEISQAAPDPRVVAALRRKRAGEFANHER